MYPHHHRLEEDIRAQTGNLKKAHTSWNQSF